MPSWDQVLKEINECKRTDALDFVRRKYLSKLQEKRNRNIICYYSGWLQKPGIGGVEIDDNDKNSFMAAIHNLDRTKGLDLILHTPGGQVAATESLVNYLHIMFSNDIVAIVPQIAMSAGTMISCSCKTIIMGKPSNLGPIDPQFNSIPAYGVISEFERAAKEIKDNPEKIPLWQMIIAKYHPTFLGDCENAISWSKEIVTNWLKEIMFKDEADPGSKAISVVEQLSNRNAMKTHSRHIGKEQCKDIGLKITDLEGDNDLQDLILTVHHSYMHTFSSSTAIKIVENHLGIATVLHAQMIRS